VESPFYDNIGTMEDTINKLETLLAKVTELGRTSMELFKLKTAEKMADVVSEVAPRAIVYILLSSFLLFLSLGLALWLGTLMGNPFYGFFTVAAFYGLIAAGVHFFMHKWLKRALNEFVIKLTLKKDKDA
jgi:hypothetical protein